MPVAPADVRSKARAYTDISIQSLAGIARAGESEAARVAASIHLLDRGWGKPDQPMSGQVDANIEIVIRQIIRGEHQPQTIEASYTKEDNADDQPL